MRTQSIPIIVTSNLKIHQKEQKEAANNGALKQSVLLNVQKIEKDG